MAQILNLYVPRCNRSRTYKRAQGAGKFQRGFYAFGGDFSTPEGRAACVNGDTWTISGGVNGTVTDASGVLVTASAPRFDFDPVAIGTCKGILLEDSTTNLLLNSLINGTNLGSQSVAVTAQQYVLSFYGTGTVTLANAFVGSLTGSGAYPTRSSLVFTPAAGTLDITVAGTVQYAQLETWFVKGPSSFVPTAGAAVTRTADYVILNQASFYQKANGPYYRSLVGNPPGFVAGSMVMQCVFDINALPPSAANTVSAPAGVDNGGNGLEAPYIINAGTIRPYGAPTTGTFSITPGTQYTIATNWSTMLPSVPGLLYVNGTDCGTTNGTNGFNSTTMTYCGLSQVNTNTLPRPHLNGHVLKVRFISGAFMDASEAPALSRWC